MVHKQGKSHILVFIELGFTQATCTSPPNISGLTTTPAAAILVYQNNEMAAMLVVILWENSFLLWILSFVLINLHGCWWPHEGKCNEQDSTNKTERFHFIHVMPLEDNRPPAPLGDGQKLHIVGVLKVSSATKHTVFTEQGFLRVQSNKLRDFRRKNCGQGLKFPPFYTMFRDHVRQTVNKLCAEAVSAVCSKLIRSDIYSVFRYYSTNSFVDEFYMSRISDINLKLQWTRRKWRPCWSAMISFCLPHLHFDQNNTVPEKSMTYLSWCDLQVLQNEYKNFNVIQFENCRWPLKRGRIHCDVVTQKSEHQAQS